MSIREKLLQYKLLQARLSVIDGERDVIQESISDIFLSKFKTVGTYSDAKLALDIILSHPKDVILSRWDLERGKGNGMKWSRESYMRSIGKLLKYFESTGLLTKEGRGVYKVANEVYEVLDKGEVENA